MGKHIFEKFQDSISTAPFWANKILAISITYSNDGTRIDSPARVTGKLPIYQQSLRGHGRKTAWKALFQCIGAKEFDLVSALEPELTAFF
jgi:hypothetical protein